MAANAGDVVHALYGETMGTRWRVSIGGARNLDLRPLHAAIQSELDRIVAQMSTWEPDSDIVRYNHAQAGSWQPLPQPFFSVLSRALEIARDSDGAFDPSVGPAVEAWGFGAGGTPAMAGAQDQAEARGRIGWRQVALRADPPSALQPGGVALDLSAIAKGHGVDAVVRALRARGIAAALVDVGGELRACGRKPDGARWQVLVEADSDRDDGAPCVLALDDLAVATSGTRWHRFERDGRLHAHTIDPRTAAPVAEAPVAVTVVAADAMSADAWATALTVMGLDGGMAFAESRGIAARFVVATDAGECVVRDTAAFRALQQDA